MNSAAVAAALSGLVSGIHLALISLVALWMVADSERLLSRTALALSRVFLTTMFLFGSAFTLLCLTIVTIGVLAG